MIIPILTGATATGKSSLGLEFASDNNAEIISADAYQVYRKMDIGTAKPSKLEQEAVKHHLIDILNPDETYSAGDFFEHTEQIIDDIVARNKIPIVVGGTGMYAETLIKGIFASPEKDEEFRKEIEEEGLKYGYPFLHKRLMSIDPEFAKNIPETDKARITRGLEINKICRMNVRDAQKAFHVQPRHKYKVFLLSSERTSMYARINERVVKMYEEGWADEVKELLQLGYNENMQSFKAIGYRETALLLKNEASFESTVSTVQQKTRNFAKRQVTWFKHMSDLEEMQVGAAENLSVLTNFARNYWY